MKHVRIWGLTSDFCNATLQSPRANTVKASLLVANIVFEGN